ncbi:hypothetical protein [Sphingomonas sp. 3-13AW]
MAIVPGWPQNNLEVRIHVGSRGRFPKRLIGRAGHLGGGSVWTD